MPEHPDWIPYRTTYYSRTWGFCLSHSQLEALGPGPFDVVIDSSIAPGELNYGELVIPGDRTDEVIISAHVCHPSLANDNLSGIVGRHRAGEGAAGSSTAGATRIDSCSPRARSARSPG